MRTFHLWGNNGEPNFISPESVALYWILKDPKYGITNENSITRDEIVFSNNTDLSPDNHLPLLIITNDEKEEPVKVSGFDNIIRYYQRVESTSVDPDNSNQLYENSLLEYVMNDMNPLTMYQLYLNSANYVGFTRKQFSQLLYFPMWYNVPINYRTNVRKQCDTNLNLEYSLIEDDPDFDTLGKESDDDSTKATDLTQSKTFKLKAKSLLKNKNELHEMKHNLQYLKKMTDVIKQWFVVRFEILPQDQEISADILLLANIYIQINLLQGDKVLEALQKELGAEKMNAITKRIDELKGKNTTIDKRSPVFNEQGNVIMSIYHKGCSYI